MNQQQKTIYALGRVYGLAASVLPKIIGAPTKASTAQMKPAEGLTQAIMLLQANNAFNDDIEAKIAEILDDIEVDAMPDGVISLNLQSTWLLGYYAGKTRADDSPHGMAAIRKAQGLTQAQLAERLGIVQRDISNYESGKIKPRLDMAKKIADALGCTIEDLQL